MGPWRDRQPGQPYDLDDLLAEHARYGIERRLVLHAESRDGVPDNGNAAIARQTLFRTDTGLIWTALPPRRFGGSAVETFLGDAQAAGVAMLALFPETHGHHLAPWANGELYAAMASVRLPLVLDLGNAQGEEVRRRYEDVHAIATAHPRLPIVLWNAFYMDERLHVPLLDACPNVRIGLATVFIPTWGIEQYTARYGPDRLIFGSNWPRQAPGPLLTYVLYADVRDHVKAAILGGTVQALAAEVRWPVHGFPATPPATVPPDAATGEAKGPTEDAAEPDVAPADAAAAPWLEALAAEQEEAERDAARPRGYAVPRDPHRAPGEEGE